MDRVVSKHIRIDDLKSLGLRTGEWVFDEELDKRVKVVELYGFERVTPGFEYVAGGATYVADSAILLIGYCSNGKRLIHQRSKIYFPCEKIPDRLPIVEVFDFDTCELVTCRPSSGLIYRAHMNFRNNVIRDMIRYEELKGLLEE